jgi:diaminopimelate epimerase
VTIPEGRPFFKMSGSGNDFVMVDARTEPPGALAEAAVVQAICARGTGVGADGIVFLHSSKSADVKLVYLNADGSLADLCGNATLCTTRLSVELGIAPPSGFRIETGSGVLAARIANGRPEIDLQPVAGVDTAPAAIAPGQGEERIGYALAGVPHLVILVADVATVDVVGRGRPLRAHPSLPAGANVNFISRLPDGRWAMRTYERGVEGETLACGTGAVSIGVLLHAWGLADGPVQLQTRSGRELTVRLNRDTADLRPSLSGEGRIVFRGILGEIAPAS